MAGRSDYLIRLIMFLATYIFRGIRRATKINETMKMAAVRALAALAKSTFLNR
jgi:malic enzyme